MNPVLTLLGKVPEAAGKYFTRRMEIKAEAASQDREFRAAVHARRMELMKEGRAADLTWELESLKAHAAGWKDEFVMILLSIPVGMCFVPGLAKYVKQGFVALSMTPWWYQTALISIYLAVYGIRWYRRQQSDT